MAWNKSLESLAREIEQAYKKDAADTAMYAFKRFKEISPVGNPDLWKSGRAPKGYKGGTFREKWELVEGKGRWLVTNPMPYAEALEEGHSSQAQDGLIDVVMADLENLL